MKNKKNTKKWKDLGGWQPLICIKWKGLFCLFRALWLANETNQAWNRSGTRRPLVYSNQFRNRCTFGREIGKCIFLTPSISLNHTLNKRLSVFAGVWGCCGLSCMFLILFNYQMQLHYWLRKFVARFLPCSWSHKSLFCIFVLLFCIQTICLHN